MLFFSSRFQAGLLSLSAASFVPSGVYQTEFHEKLPGAEPCGQTGRPGVSWVVSRTIYARKGGWEM